MTTRWLSEEAIAAHQRLYAKDKGRIVRVLDGPAKKPVAKGKKAATPKPSKYRNEKVMEDGHKFDSRKEARRYKQLLLLQAAGEITDLKLQPVIRCVVNGELVCSYVADFFYIDRGPLVAVFKDTYEDCKGYKTPIYRLKRKLVKACTGIEILET